MSQKFVYELIVRAETAQAGGALRELQQTSERLDGSLATIGQTAGAAPINQIAVASRQAATDLQRLIEVNTGVASTTGLTAAETLELGQALDHLRARFNPIFAATQRYSQELLDIAAAEELGAISAMEAAAARDRAAAAMTPAVQVNRLYSQSLDEIRTRFNPLYAASQRYEQELNDIAIAEKRGAISAMEAGAARERAAAMIVPMANNIRVLGQNSHAAAAYTANLGYQVNDVMMMAALGQNPFALMLQQGPQVVQVFNQMKTAGMAIGPALLGSVTSLINPFSLLTLGVIAGGAALVQWGMNAAGAGEDARSFDDVIGDVESSIRAVNAIAGQTSADGLADLEERYGTITAKVRLLIDAQNELTKIDALDAMQTALASINGTLDDGYFGNGLAANTGDVFGIQLRQGVGTAADANAEVAALMQRMQTLGDIDGFGAQADEAASLRAEIVAAAGGIEHMSTLQREVFRQLTAAEDAARALARASGEVAPALSDAASGALLVTNHTFGAAGMGSLLADRMTRAANATAEAEARARAYEASILRARTATELVHAAILDADTALDMLVASEPPGGWLSGAIDAAQMLAGNLWDAVTAYNTFATSTPAAGGPAGAPAEVAVTGFAGERTERQGPKFDRSRTGGGGSASQSNAVQELIDSLTGELAILRELDPVQQELLRHREALAIATENERAIIEDLIRSRVDEARTLDDVQERIGEVRAVGADVVGSIFDGLRDSATAGDMLIGVLDRITDKLYDMAADNLTDVLFGTGERGGGSGVLGGLFSSILFPAATTGTSQLRPQARPFARGDVFDRPILFGMGGSGIGLMAEAGPEAIMPLTHSYGGGVGATLGGQESTLPLTRLASGKLGVDLGAIVSPFALGSVFGDMRSALPAWREALGSPFPGAGQAGEPADTRPVISIVNNSSAQVSGEMEETTDARGQRQYRLVMSDAVAEGIATPGGRGGRTLRQVYNVRRSPRRRS